MMLGDGLIHLTMIKMIKDLFPENMNKRVPSLFKDEVGGKITEVVALRAKLYAHLIDGDGNDDYEKNKIINKKAKATKKCVIKHKLIFKNYKDCLCNNETILRSQQRFHHQSYPHKVYTEEVNKITLSSDDDKRLQRFDRITTYPYRTKQSKSKRNIENINGQL